MRRVYIAGAVTNTSDYQERFQKAEDQINAVEGLKAVSPVKLTENLHEILPDVQWEDYMEITSALLSRCDEVFFMPGWENSIGCCKEHMQALTEGKWIRYAPDKISVITRI